MITSNPIRILGTLDSHLHKPFTLYVYGRSALALGFSTAPEFMHATMDVDAILPMKDVLAIETNEDFWQAQELTNTELSDTGLYFTHLFEERQVILAKDWLERVIELPNKHFKHLKLYRPATEDLIITKMMRVDPQDREDIKFLITQDDFSKAKLTIALDTVLMPDIAELHDAFMINKNWLAEKL
jgi:Nucleotidyltransferase of unknown function (DUF6036)